MLIKIYITFGRSVNLNEACVSLFILDGWLLDAGCWMLDSLYIKIHICICICICAVYVSVFMYVTECVCKIARARVQQILKYIQTKCIT